MILLKRKEKYLAVHGGCNKSCLVIYLGKGHILIHSKLLKSEGFYDALLRSVDTMRDDPHYTPVVAGRIQGNTQGSQAYS